MDEEKPITDKDNFPPGADVNTASTGGDTAQAFPSMTTRGVVISPCAIFESGYRAGIRDVLSVMVLSVVAYFVLDRLLPYRG